jgi:hypothetical protein
MLTALIILIILTIIFVLTLLLIWWNSRRRGPNSGMPLTGGRDRILVISGSRNRDLALLSQCETEPLLMGG